MKLPKNKNGNINMKKLQEMIDELSCKNIIAGGTNKEITDELDELYEWRENYERRENN